MNDEEIKKICESYFSPLICVAHVLPDEDTDYYNNIKLCIMTKDKKPIREFVSSRNDLLVGQEIDRQKLISFLNSAKKSIKGKKK